jgi:hypothetical protein
VAFYMNIVVSHQRMDPTGGKSRRKI